MNRTLQRIYKDLAEIQENPIPGISITIPDENDPFKLIANLYILNGIYEGILLHLNMTLPPNYPFRAPKLFIASGQPFDHNFHHHIFGAGVDGYKICIDLLDHGFFGEGEKTGWTPAYTFSTLLMQMQIFFSDQHDLHNLPSNQKINELKEKLKNFSVDIKTTDGTFKRHSYNHPFPPLNMSRHTLTKKISHRNENETKKQIAYKKLICCLTKNTAEESEFLVGLPVKKSGDEYLPFMEILSYDGYHQQLLETIKNGENPHNLNMRTSFGEKYNTWLPLYVREETYIKHNNVYHQALSVLKNGSKGIQKYDFNPGIVNHLFQNIFRSLANSIQKNMGSMTTKFIEIFVYILRLYYRVYEEYKEIFESFELSEKKFSKDLIMFYVLRENFSETAEYSNLNTKWWADLIKQQTQKMFQQMKNCDLIFNSKNALKSTISSFLYLSSDVFERFNENFLQNEYIIHIFISLFFKHFLTSKEYFFDLLNKNFGVIEDEKISEFLNLYREKKRILLQKEQLMEHFKIKSLLDISSMFCKNILKLFLKQKCLFKFEPNWNIEFFIDIAGKLTLLKGFLERDKKSKELFEFLRDNPQHLEKIRLAKKAFETTGAAFPSSLAGYHLEIMKVHPKFIKYENLICEQFFGTMLALHKNQFSKNSFTPLLKNFIFEQYKHMKINIHRKFYLSLVKAALDFLSSFEENVQTKNKAEFLNILFIIYILNNFISFEPNLIGLIEKESLSQGSMNVQLLSNIFSLSYLKVFQNIEPKDTLKILIENNINASVKKNEKKMENNINFITTIKKNGFHPSDSSSALRNAYLTIILMRELKSKYEEFEQLMKSNYFILPEYWIEDFISSVTIDLSQKFNRFEQILELFGYNITSQSMDAIIFQSTEKLNVFNLPYFMEPSDFITPENSVDIAKYSFYKNSFQKTFFNDESNKILFKKLLKRVKELLNQLPNLKNKRFVINDILEFIVLLKKVAENNTLIQNYMKHYLHKFHSYDSSNEEIVKSSYFLKILIFFWIVDEQDINEISRLFCVKFYKFFIFENFRNKCNTISWSFKEMLSEFEIDNRKINEQFTEEFYSIIFTNFVLVLIIKNGFKKNNLTILEKIILEMEEFEKRREENCSILYLFDLCYEENDIMSYINYEITESELYKYVFKNI